jgi:signal transduction histidine kinase
VSRPSLRGRLAWTGAGITAAVTLIAAVTVWGLAAARLHRIDLDMLATHAEMIARLADIPGDGIPSGMVTPPPGVIPLLVLADGSGGELGRGPGTPEASGLAALATDGPRDPFSARLADGRRVLARVDRLPATGVLARIAGMDGAGTGSGVLAVTATVVAGHAQELERLAWGLAGMWAIAVVLTWVGTRVLAGIALVPVDRLARAMARLGPDRLAERVPAPEAVELAPVADRLNDLLDRVETAFRRERTTIAFLAHELRTPLAVLRATLEFRMLDGGAADGRLLSACLEQVARMQRMGDNLLVLARVESGSERIDRDPLDLAEVVRHALAAHQGAALARGVSWRARVPVDLVVVSSVVHLRLVAGNLVGNAAAHAPAGSEIEVDLRREGDRAVLTVRNPCAMACPAETLLRPFHRGGGGEGHAGLGLALCDRIAPLLGARLAVEADGTAFTATLSVPLGEG